MGLKTLLFLALLSFCNAARDKDSEKPEKPEKSEKTISIPVSFASVLQSKCDGLAFLTHFDRTTLTCVVGIPSTKDCRDKDLQLPYFRAKSSVSLSKFARKTIERIGLQKGNSEICYLAFVGSCDYYGEPYGSNCYSIEDRKPRTFPDAAEYCAKQNATLAVPHDDFDLQDILESVGYSDSSYWVGLGVNGDIWINHDGSNVDFYRWSQVEKRKFSEDSAATFIFQNDQNSYAGYLSTEKASKKLPFLCSRPIGSDYIPYKKPDDYVTVPPPTTQPPCTDKPKPIYHFAFAMDSSYSVSRKQWAEAVAWIRAAVNSFSQISTRFSFVNFSKKINEIRRLEPVWTKKEFNETVSSTYYGGGTNVNVGLTAAADILKQDTEVTLKVIVLMTDRYIDENGLSATAFQAKASGISIVGVGIGDTQLGVVQQIVSSPDTDHYATVHKPFTDLPISKKPKPDGKFPCRKD